MGQIRTTRMRTNNWRAFQIGMGAALVVLGMAAVSQRRETARRRSLLPPRDYSGRSGFPLGVEASRGLARNAPIPADMLTPQPLRPFTQGTPV